MPLTKRTYVDYDATMPITAQNMNDIQDEIISGLSYVVCDTLASVPRKIVSLPGFSLRSGATVKVKFVQNNTSANPTLNVNDTGDRAIYTNDGAVVGDSEELSWSAGSIVTFVYDGSHWVIELGGSDTVGVRGDLINHQSYAVCTTYAYAEKQVTVPGFVLEPGATVRVKFTNYNYVANPKLNVNGTGAKPIVDYSGNPLGDSRYTSLNAEDIVTFLYDGTNWVVVNKAGSSTSQILTKSASVSVTANTTTDIASIDLTYGIWLLISYMNTNTSGLSGSFAHYITNGSENQIVRSTLDGAGGSINAKVIYVTSTTTARNVKIRAYVPNAVSVHTDITAIRIG